MALLMPRAGSGQLLWNYRLVRLLGEGGMGMVFEAVHDGVGGKTAVKILRSEISMQANLAARFFNEVWATNAIQHPGIVRVFDCGYPQNRTAYLTMEFLAGESLRSRLDRARKLSLTDTVRMGRQIASALGASHLTGIVHRDLKPDNVMLVADPELPNGERDKVLDFGIAKMAENLARQTELDRQQDGDRNAAVHVSRAVQGSQAIEWLERSQRADQDKAIA